MSEPTIATLARHAANATWRDVYWAREKLLPHAGKTLRVEMWPLEFVAFTVQVSDQGDWSEAPVNFDGPPDATVHVTPAIIAKLASAPDRPGVELDISGDPGFVHALRDLNDVLPLALEERLAALIGPIGANSLSQAVRSVARWPAHAANRVGAGVAAYMTEESPSLVPRRKIEEFSEDLAALRARVDRLAVDNPPTG